MKTFLLIDGHALIYRAYHAFPTIFVSPEGQLVNAVYGFARILLAGIRELQPEYMAIAFDSKEKTRRQEEFPFYKSSRPPMPDDLIPQIEIIKDLVRALNIPQFAQATIEADDIIGSIACQLEREGQGRETSMRAESAGNVAGGAEGETGGSGGEGESRGDGKSEMNEKKEAERGNDGRAEDEAGWQDSWTKALEKWDGDSDEIMTIILTGDKDSFQLVNERVHVYLPARGKKQTAEELDADGVKRKMGIWPEQIVDFKALAGDASDDIPGVKGIGAKTATGLLVEFENLESVYQGVTDLEANGGENLTEGQKAVLKKGVVEKLKAEREMALISQRLARIDCLTEVKFNLEDCRVTNYDKGTALAILEKLDFKSLIKMLPPDKFEEDLQEALF